jgi:integrase
MATKGSVTVWEQRGRLHLRFRYQGKQHRPALGLSNTAIDWAVARSIAARIEADLKTGNFDPTLVKYGIGLQLSGGVLTARALIDRFVQSHKGLRDPDGLKKYRWILSDLERCGLAAVDCRFLDRSHGGRLIQSLRARGLAQSTIRHRIESLGTVWRWAVEEGLVSGLPWVTKDASGGIEKQPPKPFSLEEIRLILDWLDTHQSPAAGLFRFQFSTGCRTGEAIGLLWTHLDRDCRTAWIGESVVGRVRKPVKNRKPRLINLPPSIQEWLRQHRANSTQEIVFPNPSGELWTAGQLGWYWGRALNALGIPYRRPYTTRKTLISHALANGKSPVEVAAFTGHSVKILYQYYADSLGDSNPFDLLD